MGEGPAEDNVPLTSQKPRGRFLRGEALLAAGPDAGLGGLRLHAAKGGIATIGGQGIKAALRFVAIVVLARLLTPADFGLISMAMVLTAFLAVFRDSGLSAVTMQRERIDVDEVSTLFWINAAIGAIIALTTVATAPIVAWFFGDPRLTGVIASLAGSFVLVGLASQHEALLRRHLRFTTLVVIEIVALGTGIGAAILAALNGWQYWAIVLQQLISAAVNTVGVWVACPWRPGPPGWSPQVRSMLTFGGHVTGFGLINYFARNLDDLLIGRVWGGSALGLYSKAYAIMMLPIVLITQPLAGIAIPTLSRLVQSPIAYRSAYLKVLRQLTLVCLPLVALVITTADWMVELLLGADWAGAAPILSWLGVAALAQPISNTTGWLFISQDRTAEMLRWGLIGSSITAASFLVGLRWGVVGVAAAYAISGITLRLPLLLWFVGRCGPVQLRDFGPAIVPSVVTASSVGVAVHAFRQIAPLDAPLRGLLIAGSIGLGAALAATLAQSAGRQALGDTRSILLLAAKPRG